jgi:uncharacterized protein (DUF2164 family)
MDIKLPKDTEQRLIASIQRYLDANFGIEAGDLKAQLLLKYCLEEIAPSVYNLAISDAQSYLQERVADLENVCFAHEFGYWNTAAGKAQPRRPERRK